jgi:putative transcriptional regulator
MDKTLFEDLTQSLKEAAAIRRGELAPGRVTEINLPDVKAIRSQIGLTQSDFARMMGVKVTTLRNWEQHRRSPKGSAAVLLTIIANESDTALHILNERRVEQGR